MNTRRFLRRLAVIPVLAMVALGFASGTADAAPGDYTCTGGTLPSGTYSSLTITGACSMNSGDLTVTGNVTVGPTSAARLAIGYRPSARLTVKGSLTANGAGNLTLGCKAFTDCDTNTVTVAGSVSIARTSTILLSGVTVGGNLAVSGTAGACASDFAYVQMIENTVRGSLSVTGTTPCFVVVNANDVNGSMTITGNTAVGGTGYRSGIGGNTIRGNLACAGNTSATQTADPAPNVVKGRTTGDCTFPATGS